MSGVTPYVRLGDKGVFALLAVLLLVMYGGRYWSAVNPANQAALSDGNGGA
jgi:apolipoprotein N-acyltransferase